MGISVKGIVVAISCGLLLAGCQGLANNNGGRWDGYDYGYGNNYGRPIRRPINNRRPFYEAERARIERDRARNERERLRLERERLARERERLERERQRPVRPPVNRRPTRPDRCPSGFRPSERKCTPKERRRGCKDLRTRSGLGCVKR